MKLKDIVSQLANRINQPHVIEIYIRQVYAKGFVNGTKKSPWISVNEQLPETDNGQSLYEVIVVTGDKRFLVVINTEVEHLIGLLGVTHWMPIPSFDNILEANKDVLKRIKEKGD